MPRIVLFGMRCRFSATVLQSLVERGRAVAGVVLAGARGEETGRDLPVHRYVKPGTVEAIAQEAGIPVRIAADLRGSMVLDALSLWKPDAIAVACFPLRLPPDVLAFPRLGALNVHPSLLPRHRGPDPIFWTFRDGDSFSGATVHLMTSDLDAGPIVAQEKVAVPFGIDGAEFETHLAELGGALLAHAITARGLGDFSSTAQDESLAQTDPFPGADDLAIRTDGPGRFAFSFVRGATGLGFTVSLFDVATGISFEVDRAHSYAPAVRQDVAIVHNNGRLSVPFVDGICEFSGDKLRKTFKLRVDSGIAGMG